MNTHYQSIRTSVELKRYEVKREKHRERVLARKNQLIVGKLYKRVWTTHVYNRLYGLNEKNEIIWCKEIKGETVMFLGIRDVNTSDIKLRFIKVIIDEMVGYLLFRKEDFIPHHFFLRES